MARKKTRRRRSTTLKGLDGSGKSFVGSIAGEKMHCKLLGRPGKTRKLRCESFKGGPGMMSKASRRRAGVKSLNKERATVPVAKAKAVIKSGKKKGKARKGCRLVKGGKAKCTPTVAKRLKSRKSSTKRKRKSSKRRRRAA
jgi:hypothetical protein